VSDIAFCLLILLWLTKAKDNDSRLGNLKWPQFFYVLGVIPSLLITGDLSASLVGFFALLKLYIFYCYIFKMANDDQKTLFFIDCFSLLNVLLVIGTLTEIFIYPIKNIYGLELFSRRNYVGFELMQLSLIQLGYLFYRGDHKRKTGKYVLFVVGIIGILLNQSRGAWMSFCFGMIVFFILSLRAHVVKMGQIASILVLVMLLIVGGMPYLQERLKGAFQDESAQSRIPLMELAFEIIRANPLLGVGLNTYKYEMKRYIRDSLNIRWVWTVHNQYLLVWAESGLIGLLAFIGMLASTVRRGILTLKYDSNLAPIVLGCVAGFFGFFAHMLVDSFGETWIIWANMGIISAAFKKSRIGMRNE
jgi:O-antigen ligase